MKNHILTLIGVLSLVLLSCKNDPTTAEGIRYQALGIDAVDIPFGLKKGDKAPQVELLINGVKTPLSDLYSKQVVALFFYRGNWCPECNKQLAEFTERARNLTAKGIKLIAITPENQEGIDKMRENTGANFLIVSDVDGSIQEGFDVAYLVNATYTAKIENNFGVSIAENNANRKAELPVPATYVIDRNGEIMYSHFDVDYTNRASIDDILKSVY